MRATSMNCISALFSMTLSMTKKSILYWKIHRSTKWPSITVIKQQKKCDIISFEFWVWKKKWKIKIHIQKLEFKIKLISHNTCKVEYDKNVKKHFKNSRTTFFSFNMLEIDNYTIIAQFNQFFIFTQYFIYIHEQKLKNNAFEKMNKIINVNIDGIYVRKKFY